MNMKLLISCLFLLFIGFLSQASEVRLSENHRVYYNVSKSKKPAKATILLFNGLVYPTTHWQEYVQRLNDLGYDVVQTAYSAQPESLTLLGSYRPYFQQKKLYYGVPIERGFSLDSLADEMATVLKKEGLRDVIVLALSYGAFPATRFLIRHGDLVRHAVYMSPGIRPTQGYQAIFRLTGVNTYLELGESNPAIDIQYMAFLRSTVLSRLFFLYGQYVRIIPKKLSYKDFSIGVYHLVRAARYSNLHKKVGEISHKKVSFLLAGEEAQHLFKDQISFWKKLSNKGPLIVLDKAKHDIPKTSMELGALVFDELVTKSLGADKYRAKLDAKTGKLKLQLE